VDTRQIMQPETYLLHQVVPQLAIPDFDKMVAPSYTRIDFGGMGEFDVYLLAKQYGVKDPPDYYRHWRGGYYYAAQAKNGPKDRISLLYFSRWDSPEAASDFARLYLDYLPKRTKVTGLSHVGPMKQDGTAHVTDELPGEVRKPEFNVVQLEDKDGPIQIERQGSDVLIIEGFDNSVIAKARDVLLYGMSPPASAKEKNSR
jgi:hypothetical protein